MGSIDIRRRETPQYCCAAGESRMPLGCHIRLTLLSTQIQHSTTSYLTLLESVTASVIATLLAQQALSPLSGLTTLVLPASPPALPAPIRLELTINRTVSMPMLQRIKRQYTKLNQRAGSELTSEQVARLFGQYLENNL